MVANTLISFIDEYSVSKELFRKSEELKDLIRHRLGKIGLLQTIDGLRPDLWELKMRATDLITSSGGLSEMPDLLQESYDELLQYDDQYTQHSLHAFEIYRKTVIGFMERFSSENEADLRDVKMPPDLDMPYDTIEELQNLPQWNFRYLGNWLNSSLDLDISLLILSIHREEKVITNQDEFIDFIRAAGENFGAYAAVLDLWHIPKEDESQPIRNTKIVAAMLRSKTSLPRPSYSSQELKTMLTGG